MNPHTGPVRSRPAAWRVAVAVTVCLAAAVTVLAAPTRAERLSVSADVANIRSGPGTEYDVIWQVERYHPLAVVEKQGPWYRFQDFEKDVGWIHRSLVGSVTTVITIKDECNIRSGPDTDHDVLITVGKGIPFRTLETRGGWIHIEHADGDRGWIHRSLVW